MSRWRVALAGGGAWQQFAGLAYVPLARYVRNASAYVKRAPGARTREGGCPGSVCASHVPGAERGDRSARRCGVRWCV